ncbi:MAG: Threonine synthase [Firmicutes bacterium ADurb.Bin248]|jgi:threonine synthase|nr:MAG: Threonine synthase [Firmicutes bacterium ADurb.Bin248]HOG00702.1 threonine synthase [Clostridia bacterium]
MNFVCTSCGKRETASSLAPRCPCGGLWKLDFTPPPFDPALFDGSARGVFRYRAFLPLEGGAWRSVTLGEGATPIARVGGALFKLDFLMPTLSFKDRGAAVLAARMKELGVARAVQDSSGNAGNSVAAYCARAGIACEIFVPEGTSPGKIDMIRAHGATCILVPGDRDRCAEVCRARVENEGLFYASHVYNPYFYEGTKTYVYEIYEQLGGMPEALVLPLGNGTLLLGAMLGLEHLLASGRISDMPRILAVQSANCAPILEARRLGLSAPAPVKPLPTLAEGIAIGKPARGTEILGYIRKHNVEVIPAPEDGIAAARDALAREGIFVEYTSAATYAAYLDYVNQRGPIGECLLPATGAGLKGAH